MMGHNLKEIDTQTERLARMTTCPKCNSVQTKKYNYECGTYWSGDGYELHQSQYCETQTLRNAILNLRRNTRNLFTTRQIAEWLGVSTTQLCEWAPAKMPNTPPDFVDRAASKESAKLVSPNDRARVIKIDGIVRIGFEPPFSLGQIVQINAVDGIHVRVEGDRRWWDKRWFEPCKCRD